MMNESNASAVKKISARTLEECKSKLYSIYGQDYEILSKKLEVKGGFLGFWQKEVVTVEYVERNRQTNDFLRQTAAASQDAFSSNRQKLLDKLAPSAGGAENLVQFAKISRQIDNFEKRIADSLQEIVQTTGSREEHKNIVKIRNILQENEFSPNYINAIAARINREFSVDDLDDFEKMQQNVMVWIGNDIHIAPPVRERIPKVIMIVGPTGVGKTTTIAKLAASVILDHHRKNAGNSVPPPKIRMITTDSMRVGAEEQIKNWGETMDIPVDKAEYASDLLELFDFYKDTTDYIFVDTSGYSPNDYVNIGNMHSRLDVKGLDANIFLAFSATSKARDIENIICNYEQFNYKGVIITKCDESSSLGNVISVLAEKNKRIAFITDGQNVVENRSVSSIRRATKLGILRTITGINVNNDYLEAKFQEESSDSLI